MTTASDLADELEGLAKEATPGEWANGLDDLDCVWSREPTSDGNVVCLPPEDMMELSMERWPANAALIVALRNNLPEILSALRRVDVMREALERAEQFIVNGTELGFIRMPETADDPAHFTLPVLRQALTGEA